jgi:hypothetical protein
LLSPKPTSPEITTLLTLPLLTGFSNAIGPSTAGHADFVYIQMRLSLCLLSQDKPIGRFAPPPDFEAALIP